MFTTSRVSDAMACEEGAGGESLRINFVWGLRICSGDRGLFFVRGTIKPKESTNCFGLSHSTTLVRWGRQSRTPRSQAPVVMNPRPEWTPQETSIQLLLNRGSCNVRVSVAKGSGEQNVTRFTRRIDAGGGLVTSSELSYGLNRSWRGLN